MDIEPGTLVRSTLKGFPHVEGTYLGLNENQSYYLIRWDSLSRVKGFKLLHTENEFEVI